MLPPDARCLIYRRFCFGNACRFDALLADGSGHRHGGGVFLELLRELLRLEHGAATRS